MASRKNKAESSDVQFGSGFKPKPRNNYPFDVLKKKGDYFVWPDREDDHTLRQQALRRKRSTGIDYRVTRAGSKIAAAMKIDNPNGVIVYHNGRVSKAKR